MSDKTTSGPLAHAQSPSRHDFTVEQILQMRQPFVATLIEPLHKLALQFAKSPVRNENVYALEAERQRLLSLSRDDLLREYAEEFLRFEGRQFFNEPRAIADFEHWTLIEHWTIEESVALVLGRNPDVVKWEKLKPLEYRGFRFVQQFSKLLQIAQRAEALQSNRVKPTEVWNWAERTGVVTPPARLRDWLHTRGFLSTKSADASSSSNSASQDGSPASGSKWTPQMLAKLSAYREQHGTKAAAAHFGISAARVRRLLPTEPKTARSASVFTHRPK